MAFVEEVDTEPRAPVSPRKKRGPPPLVKYYLVLYNVLSTLGWAYLLVRTLAVLLTSSPSSPLPFSFSLPVSVEEVIERARTAHGAVGADVALVQSFAALEVLHVLLGWVRSPLATTAVQVASRLYLVWGVVAQFPQTHTNPLYASMVLSWALTEVVRYSFYACALLGHEPRALVYLRYTLFYVLYPTGASSEALLIYATLPHPAFAFPPGTLNLGSLHTAARELLFAVWWPGLYVMYAHMMKQRRKVLGPAGRTGGTKPKSA